MKTKLNKIVVALAMLYLAPASMAQGEVLDGQTVRTSFITTFHGAPNPLVIPFDVVVGPETEIVNTYFPPTFDNFISIDFSDTNILITLVSGREFPFGSTIHGISFQDALGTIPRFTSATFDPVATTWPEYSDGRSLSVHANEFGFFLRGGFPGAQLSLDITAMIPEPAAASLLLVGFAFLVTTRGCIPGKCVEHNYRIGRRFRGAYG